MKYRGRKVRVKVSDADQKETPTVTMMMPILT
jgi:hypothetical protein